MVKKAKDEKFPPSADAPIALVIYDTYRIPFLIYNNHPHYDIIKKEQEENGDVSRQWFYYSGYGYPCMADLKADKVIYGLGVGVPGKPVGGSEYYEYRFPDSIKDLSLEEIGEWTFKIEAWYSYCLSELGRYEGNLVALKDFYEIGIMKYAEEKMTGKMIEYKACEADEKYKKAKDGITTLKGIVARLQRLCESYKSQIDVLSREMTRRQLEARL